MAWSYVHVVLVQKPSIPEDVWGGHTAQGQNTFAAQVSNSQGHQTELFQPWFWVQHTSNIHCKVPVANVNIEYDTRFVRKKERNRGAVRCGHGTHNTPTPHTRTFQRI